MIVTLAEVKEYLGITDSSQDDLLTNLIVRAGKYLDTACNRAFEQADFTEFFDGNSNDTIVLFSPPIDFNGTYGIDSYIKIADTVVDEENFALYEGEGRVTLKGLSFPTGVKNVEFKYKGGFENADIPEDVQQAAIELVTSMKQTHDAQGLEAESIGDYSVDYKKGPDAAKVSSAYVDAVIDFYKIPFMDF